MLLLFVGPASHECTLSLLAQLRVKGLDSKGEGGGYGTMVRNVDFVSLVMQLLNSSRGAGFPEYAIAPCW